MFELSIRGHFDSAHFLRGYQGRCENLHGHRYDVTVYVRSGQLNAIGLAYDFADLKGHLKQILTRYDHVCLNEIQPFTDINPSAENIALTLYQELRPYVNVPGVTLHRVDVWESPGSCATYIPDGN
ncbi:MAG: 6-carboxytetrahydropterin synthase QueD [Chloroflexota bacterium]|nr:MAG: 6-carboxytetrahydropterin synthase QueD [Chloroflexota bacterium]